MSFLIKYQKRLCIIKSIDLLNGLEQESVDVLYFQSRGILDIVVYFNLRAGYQWRAERLLIRGA